jgi:hypothetical protein
MQRRPLDESNRRDRGTLCGRRLGRRYDCRTLDFFPGVDLQQSRQAVTQTQIITVDGFRKTSDLSIPDDIAFIVLSAEIPGGTITRLATAEEVASWTGESRVVTFLGYGRTSPSGTSSMVPNQINQPLTSGAQWPGAFTAAQTTTTGVCVGDSGGPVITQVENETVLVGINSAASGPCAATMKPSMIGFIPAAFPALTKKALEAATKVSMLSVTTGTASSIASDSARFSGIAKSNSASTLAFFQVAATPDFQTLVATVAAGEVVGGEPVPVSATVSGLNPGTTYYWRLATTSAAGTAVGATMKLTTPLFRRQFPLSFSELLNILSVERAIPNIVKLAPVAKSKLQCTLKSQTGLLTFKKSGLCRVKLTIRSSPEPTVEFYNLAVR